MGPRADSSTTLDELKFAEMQENVFMPDSRPDRSRGVSISVDKP
jgi:hypothetical protein